MLTGKRGKVLSISANNAHYSSNYMPQVNEAVYYLPPQFVTGPNE
jgi:hypothetical protein